jgi:LysM repeat protein
LYITATFSSQDVEELQTTPSIDATALPSLVRRTNLSPIPEALTFQPTPDFPRFDVNVEAPQEHVVKSGDTLYGIAVAYGATIDSILAVNELDNPDSLVVGQVIKLPDAPVQQTPQFKIMPDSKLIRGPGSGDFDITRFINQQPGYIRIATDIVPTRLADNPGFEESLTAAQVVERVSIEYSVDPRLLLALLEYRGQWLSDPSPAPSLKTNPLISEADSAGIDRSGLYKQLAWAANQLNFGYYGWKYRGWTTLEFAGGQRLLYAPGLNAGAVALQYYFSLNKSFNLWQHDIDQSGFFSVYYTYFGNPFAGAIDPIVPVSPQQPPMTLPFAQGEVWLFTGGAHGGWGTGSAWSAIDFATPDDPPEGVACYTSEYWARAVTAGVIARSGYGAVVLDLDGDGDETTGWTVLYLHIAAQDRIAVGATVQIGDTIGHPSCEGGFSTATHLHIARRYNGEWIPADCFVCAPQHDRPSFTMSGWSVDGIENQEYQGFLDGFGERRTAEQGRLTAENRVSW